MPTSETISANKPKRPISSSTAQCKYKQNHPLFSSAYTQNRSPPHKQASPTQPSITTALTLHLGHGNTSIDWLNTQYSMDNFCSNMNQVDLSSDEEGCTCDHFFLDGCLLFMALATCLAAFMAGLRTPLFEFGDDNDEGETSHTFNCMMFGPLKSQP